MTDARNATKNTTQDPLTLSFALNGPGYIEASAGTGKTFTITCLITRLLLGSPEYAPVPLDKMLIMTFTRSAARDLRRKIRERLTKVMALFQDHADEEGLKKAEKELKDEENRYLEPFLRIFEKTDETLSEETVRAQRNRTARHILRDAITNIDKASISTIHSFCASMLKRHAISARIPFSQNLLTDDKATQKCAEAVKEAVRELFYDKELTQEETDILLEESGIFNNDDWLDNLTGLLENNYGPSFSMHRYDGAERLIAAKSLKEMLRMASEMTKEQDGQTAKLADELRESCQDFFKIKFFKNGSFSGGTLDSGYSAERCVAFFREYLAKRDGKNLLDCIGSNAYKADKEKFDKVKDNPEVIRCIGTIENVLKYSVSLKPLVYDKVLTRASEILEQKKDIEGFLFQNDLLSRLKDALVKQDQGEDTGIPGLSSSEILRDAILEDYPVAIIDEFQDTDPIQFSIVSQVYLNYFKVNRDAILTREHRAPDKEPWPNIQGFYIIGDPKQSIYLFRGADVSCYNDAVKGIGDFWGENDPNKKHQGTLGTNFRSNPVLVGQVNSLFESLSQDLAASGDSDSAASDEALEERSLSAPQHDDAADYHASYVRGKSWQFSPVKSVMEIPEKRDEPQTFLVLRTPENSDDKAGDPKAENPKTVIPAPLTFFYHDFSDSKDSVSAPAMRRELAASCAREIVTVLNQGWLFKSRLADLTVPPDKLGEPVKLSDIAVLVSGKKEAKWISAELARYDVPAVYTSNRMSITETLEFESVYNLMEAFLNPKDNEKLRFLVSSSFFNYTAQDISEELSKGFEDISAALAEGVALWRDNDFMSAYCCFTKKLDIIKNLSRVIGGDAIITNLNQAAEIAQSLSSRASAFDGIVSLYRRLMDEPESDESSQEMSDYAIRAGGNENVIRITTYHSSKGLEYNIVFMPFAGVWKNKFNGNAGFSPISYLDSNAPEGEGHLRYDITGDPALKNQHLWNEMGESLRLWYVAATRAKYAMFVWTGFMGEDRQKYFAGAAKYISYYLPLYVELRQLCGQQDAENASPRDTLRQALVRLFTGNEKNRPDLEKIGNLNSMALRESDPNSRESPETEKGACHFLISSLAELTGEPSQKSDSKKSNPEISWDSKRRKLQLGDSNPNSGVRPFEGNIPNNWRILSYSALVSAKTHHGAAASASGETGGEDENHNTEELPELSQDDPRIAIPGGIATGLFLHGIFERLSFDSLRDDRTKLKELREQKHLSRQDLLDSIKAARVIAERLDTFPDSGEWSQDDRKFLNLLEWILCAAETPLKAGSNENAAPFALRDLRDNHTVKEMEFYMRVPRIKNMAALNNIVRSKEYAEDKYVGNLYHLIGELKDEQVITAKDVQGFMTGSLDLFFEHDGKYYVADYKSNIITENRNKQGLYNREAMQRTIYDSHYDFQYVIYTVAMHRFLKHKLGDSYDYDTHIGGIYYLFLRGMRGENSEINGSVPGVYYVRLPRELVEKADQFFANAEENEKGSSAGSSGNPESNPKQNNQQSGNQQNKQQSKQ